MSPYAEAAAPPPGRRVSPFQSCQAQKPVLGKPSGWAPFGEKMTYCALRLAAAVVLPKWPAAFTASTAIWWPFVFASTEVLSYQTPASPPPPEKAFILACAVRVGTAPWRYGCWYEGAWGSAVPGVACAAEPPVNAPASTVSAAVTTPAFHTHLRGVRTFLIVILPVPSGQ